MQTHHKIAIEAALLAGREIMNVYNRNVEVQIKEDKSPLTEADLNANKIINIFLEKTDIPIISEENSEIPYNDRKNWKEFWMVDPLDGTKEFIKKNGEFTVNIALICDNTPVFGVVYAPAVGRIYFANVKDCKAFMAEVNMESNLSHVLNSAKKVKPSTVDNLKRIVVSRSHMDDNTTRFVHQIKQTSQVDLISQGSSLKFCLLIEGKADIYPRFAPTMEWDTAAAHALCKAVGVQVMNWEEKKELTYNKENLLNPWFICQ
jgi:3'(2'), 5'-bisphosphate nucleotidase